MTPEQVWNFCELNQHIKCKDLEVDSILFFRNENLSYYINDDNRWVGIAHDDIQHLKNEAHLLKFINHIFEVECITRITGYMSKVSGWNKGKIAELHDRRKHDVETSGSNSSCPAAQAVG